MMMMMMMMMMMQVLVDLGPSTTITGEKQIKKEYFWLNFSSTSVLSQKYKSIQDIMMGMMSPEFFFKNNISPHFSDEITLARVRKNKKKLDISCCNISNLGL